MLEKFYSIQENQNVSPTDALAELYGQLRELCPDVIVPHNGSTTFIVKYLPFGIAFQENPSTHLRTYPDLGITIINGMAKEQADTHGTSVAILVDPATTPAPEIEVAAKILTQRRIFVRGYSGPGATVRSVSEMVELFPYDLLVFATHCGDSDGHRWTYEFQDSEGIDRILIVDIALSIGQTDEKEMLDVTQFLRFHSLDGIDWSDPQKTEKVYVGNSIRDFLEKTNSEMGLEPVKKELIPRVLGSAALKMFDHIYIPMPQSLAGSGTPIIINNACVSWHELSGRFTFGNARAYIGTLYPITTIEAHEVLEKVLEKHFEKFLPHALWAAQNSVYGNSIRRPYVMTGIYTQRFGNPLKNTPEYVLKELQDALIIWRKRLAAKTLKDDSWLARRTKNIVDYYQREEMQFRTRWFKS